MNDQQRPWGETTPDGSADAVAPTQELTAHDAGTQEIEAATPPPGPAAGRGDDPVLDTFDARPNRPAGPPEGVAPDSETSAGGTRSTPGPGATPTSGAAEPLVGSGPRTSTIVWGLIVLGVGLGLLARTAGLGIDGELAAIVLLAGAGGLLVVASLVGAARRRRRPSPPAPPR